MTEAEYFDRYLQGLLKSSEQDAFEKRLSSDEDFAERFRLYKEVDKAILQRDLIQFRSKLEFIQIANPDLHQADASMDIIVPAESELDDAILQHDILALRDQLNVIHAEVEKDIEVGEIQGYGRMDRAVGEHDTLGLREGLSVYNQSEGAGEMSAEEAVLAEIDSAILQSDVMDLRHRLAGIGSQTTRREKVTMQPARLRIRVISAAAAVLVLALASTLYLSTQGGSPSPDRLDARYFVPFDFGGSERGVQMLDASLLKKAQDQYREGHYEAAYGFLTEISELDHLTVFYLGITSYLTGRTEQAEKWFNQYIESGEIAFRQPSEYYLAGCYLRQNRDAEAREAILGILGNSRHDHYEQAQRLFRKID